jgi:menaquinone-dependent protoporphyrinogen IX oxidase
MKGLIVYKGKYGATRDYAQWLSEDLKLPKLFADEVTKKQISDCDFLLIGTSVYFGKFKIKHWLKANVHEIRDKKLFLFVVNATPPEERLKHEKFVYDNVPAEIKQQCEVYFLPGRVIHKELTWTDRMILDVMGRFEKDPRKKAALDKDIDHVEKKNLFPLVNAVENFCVVDLPLEHLQ